MPGAGPPVYDAFKMQGAWPGFGAVVVPALLALSCSGTDAGDACTPDDADGVIGGKVTRNVTVDDDGYMPINVTVQNLAVVTLVLTNAGTVAHGFEVKCLATPNDTGCPTKSCFPPESTIEPIDPGETAAVKFTVPLVEGAYAIRSTADDGVAPAQFVVQ
jgi:hypothetical protein